ncbi:glutaredoxin family protein [Candidatus Saccharibacteria bacterium]|nr:glutaredoxin family protein [Candidatus Saccharibacteria bacterium]MBQ9484524.1 glutaredoxin family protein [Candidatus Saccharibacteria bacterium]
MIKVYTTPTCAYCHALMDWLESRGVDFVEMDATKEKDIKTVPVTEINGERIVGFDRPAIKRALKNVASFDK